MSRRYGRASRGQRLDIPADSWNGAMRAAEYVDGVTRASDSPLGLVSGVDREVLYVKNTTGGDLTTGSILKISGLEIDRAANESHFLYRPPVITGGIPTGDTDSGQFVVLLEPIPDGKIGRCAATGVVPVKVEMVDEGHRRAEVKASTSLLESGLFGSAQLLWIEDPADRAVAGEAWCLARLGQEPIDSNTVVCVTASMAVVGADNRWEYSVQPANWNGTSEEFEASGGGTITGVYNLFEMGNTAGAIAGGVATSGTGWSATPTAVPNGTPGVLRLFDNAGETIRFFQALYALNPVCDP